MRRRFLSDSNNETIIDYSKRYFTICALSDGDLTLKIPSSYTKGTLAYSLNYKDWIYFDSKVVLSLKTEDEVRVKCITSAYSRGSYSPMFENTGDFEVFGNIMSLLYGDSFFGKTELKSTNGGGNFAYSFASMFYNQKTLIESKNLILPATRLIVFAYLRMFESCLGLRSTPELPATTLAKDCYTYMFSDCEALTEAPQLPATELADECYSYMFSYCTNLVKAPELPATTLASYCYYEMFYGCTSLTEIPQLPATTLAKYCYSDMFSGCISLTEAPELPATTLASGCYFYMFCGCTSLTTAPKLPATTLANSCYYQMFRDCTKLNKITMLATDISASGCLTNWTSGVASTGTFKKHEEMNSLPIGVHGIPEGWVVKDDYSQKYFTIRALSDGDLTLEIPSSYTSGTLAYSLNNGDWTYFSLKTTLNLITGDEVRLRCVTESYHKGSSMFSGTCEYEAFGNIMSLLYGNSFQGKRELTSSSFRYLFYNSALLKNAENLELPATTLASNCYQYMFYGCTSLTKAPELPATTLANYCYYHMFYGCTSLTKAPELPATTLAERCYYYMFGNCTGLTEAPELPATKIAGYCYYDMFYNCTSLTEAPELPATTLADWCYYGMFESCKSLVKTPNLPATTLANSCYYSMFRDCSALEEIGEFPATTLASGCYRDMFIHCRKLSKIPKILPARELKSSCYERMFYACSSIKQAPELPATILANYCYYGMFWYCSGLTEAPELPVTTLASYCYGQMFSNCTSLTEAPQLPATTLANSCYSSMFNACTKLTEAPELPATTLASYCYQNIFKGCTKLNKITMLATDISASGCLFNWTSGVASTGTFIKNSNMTSLPSGPNGIPEGWEVKDLDYFTIEALEDGLNARLLTNDCKYCIDGGNWVTLKGGAYTTSINRGHTISFKSNLTPNSTNGIGTFEISKKCNLKGNIMSLLFEDNIIDVVDLTGKDYAFYKLFKNNTNIVDISKLKLPATTLVESCYREMFYGCTSLKSTTLIELPAMTLATNCYRSMFYGCTSLTKALELPATTLANRCYFEMFSGCTSLTTTPALPATTLADSCYNHMFYGTNVLPDCSNIDFTSKSVVASCGLQGLFAGTKVTDNDLMNILPKNNEGKYCLPVTILDQQCYSQIFCDCTSLRTAPVLPATSLTYSCYAHMFQGCSSLTTAPELPATTLASYCYYCMFRGCTSLTSAPELPATTLAEMCYYYMFFGCSSLTTAPELPATTLAKYCYSSMFSGCSKLNYIKMLAINISAVNCLTNWTSGVASSGTFVKHPDMTTLSSGTSGIPKGWTVVDYVEKIDYPKEYFTLHALGDGDMTLYIPSSYTTAPSYSLNGGSWTTFTSDTTLSLKSDDKVSVKCVTDAYTMEYSSSMFEGAYDYEVYGNIMSLLYGDDFIGQTTLTTPGSLQYLLYEQTKLKSAENLILPATTLAVGCYYQMFWGCDSLTTAPELPATTLADWCYAYMFYGCTSLTVAPELPATTLVDSCYSVMFYGCSKLNKITMLATNMIDSSYIWEWVRGVASSGTFVKNAKMTSLPSGVSGIPKGWAVQDYV